MRRGFTLLELIVVIIIIGILSTLALGQYMKVVEKGRTAEAKANLSLLREMMVIYYQENGTFYSDVTSYGLPNACASKFYYSYGVTPGTADASSVATATRCTGSGKAPNVAAASVYSVSLTMEGTMAGGPGG